MKKRIILTLCLVFCLLMISQIGCLAADNDTKSLGKAVSKGDIITLGTWSSGSGLFGKKEEIQWQVLKVKDGKALCISRYAIASMPFQDETSEVDPKDSRWENCTLRRWLNEDFFQKAFSGEEAGYIVNASVPAEENEDYHSDAGKDTVDHVFLLSIGEARTCFASDEERKLEPAPDRKKTSSEEELTGIWWLRSPGRNDHTGSLVMSDGFVDIGNAYKIKNYDVRPAIWLNVGNASPDTPDSQPQQKENVKYKKGDLLLLGRYEQDGDDKETEEIPWIIIHKDGDKALLVSRDILDVSRFTGSNTPVTEPDAADSDCFWEDCGTRTWLNDGFYQTAFDSEDKKAIMETKVSAQSSPFTPSCPQGGDTVDHVFLLSPSEVTDYMTNPLIRAAKPTEYAKSKGLRGDEGYEGNGSWWLRTACYDIPRGEGHHITIINPDSTIEEHGRSAGSDIFGIRPSIWVDLSAKDFTVTGNMEEELSVGTDKAEKLTEDTFASLQSGDRVLFGSYEQDNDKGNGPEDISWIVLDKPDEHTVLLLSTYILDYQCYYPFKTKQVEDIIWQDTSIRQWLNAEFISKAFTGEERGYLSDIQSDKASLDKVTIPSFAEINTYIKGNEVLEADLKARATEYVRKQYALELEPYYSTCSWMCRTQNEMDTDIYSIDSRGFLDRVDGSLMDITDGVRPMIKVSWK
ncbi:MAG: hypothetical protein IJ137_00580 [Eubacterium sp.]|nr:hypothetical protein [Eubacterium sp.]